MGKAGIALQIDLRGRIVKHPKKKAAATGRWRGLFCPSGLGDLARCQANGAIQANDFAVEHVVLKNVLGQFGVILWGAQA